MYRVLVNVHRAIRLSTRNSRKDGRLRGFASFLTQDTARSGGMSGSYCRMILFLIIHTRLQSRRTLKKLPHRFLSTLVKLISNSLQKHKRRQMRSSENRSLRKATNTRRCKHPCRHIVVPLSTDSILPRYHCHQLLGRLYTRVCGEGRLGKHPFALKKKHKLCGPLH